MQAITNVAGVDDGPFDRKKGSAVPVITTVFAKERLDGLLIGEATHDGADATEVILKLINDSRFLDHLQCVFLQGLTIGGFNVIDIEALSDGLQMPIIAVARKAPNLESIQQALGRVDGGDQKWDLIRRAGKMRQSCGVWVQHRGISKEQADLTVAAHQRYGSLPEPLRLSHLLGAAIVTGHSHGNA